MGVKVMSKKMVVILAVIFLAIGGVIATLYWTYPPFKESLISTSAFIYTWTLATVTSMQPMWLGMAVGGAIIGFFAFTGHSIWVFIKNLGFRKTVEPVMRQSQPTYTPTVLNPPQSLSAATVPPSTSLPALEEKSS